MTGALPKQFKPVKIPYYISWLHTQPCIVTGQMPVIVHHLRSATQSKDDRYAVPLIEKLHAVGNPNAVHEIGWENFECVHGVDLYAEAERHWAKWQRYLQDEAA